MSIYLVISELVSYLRLLQSGDDGNIPGIGTRISVLVIGAFLLLVGGMIIWLRIIETGGPAGPDDHGKSPEIRNSQKERKVL